MSRRKGGGSMGVIFDIVLVALNLTVIWLLVRRK